MNTLITPATALRIAFDGGDPLPPGLLSKADIAAAEERYIVPVIGQPLHERLLTGSDAAFVSSFLAVPTALFTRLLVQPRLDIRTGRCGTTAPKPDGAQPAGDRARRELLRALRTEARTLLRRAVRHLESRPDEFPEYDPRGNIRNRCSLDGDLVQTR